MGVDDSSPVKGVQSETHSKIMNEIVPPPLENASQPKTIGLAIWSLVLGILSLACFTIFTGIPGVICGHKALSKIKRSNGALTGQGLAIAGLVTGYLGIAWAIFVIPLMMAIAIPNFVKARDTAQMNACINNLRMIDAAKNEWALENNKKSTDTPSQSDLAHYLKNGQFPTCPKGGTYTIGSVGEAPTCSVSGHKLPQ
jgi:competence protein ComGC